MPARAGRDTDPMVGFQFGIDFGSDRTGYFTECSGLELETEVVEHKVVDKRVARRLFKKYLAGSRSVISPSSVGSPPICRSGAGAKKSSRAK